MKEKETCHGLCQSPTIMNIFKCLFQLPNFLSFLMRMYYFQNQKGEKYFQGKKKSPSDKNNGRHKSQTQ